MRPITRMRLKFALSVVFLGCILLGAATLLSRVFRSRTETPSLNSAQSPRPLDQDTAQKSFKPDAVRWGVIRSDFVNVTSSSAPEGRNEAESVIQRVEDLEKLAVGGDSVSRDALVAELDNPDADVRAAALDALIHLDDRSLVPRLREIAARTEDAVEKGKILEAADYISLPSFQEYLAQRNAHASSAGPAP